MPHSRAMMRELEDEEGRGGKQRKRGGEDSSALGSIRRLFGRRVHFEKLTDKEEDDHNERGADVEMQTPPSATSTPDNERIKTEEETKKLTLLDFVRIYYRAFLLLGDEIRLGYILGVANIFLSIALLAEPLLFGSVINALTQLRPGDSSTLWQQLLPLLILWSSFSLFGACASIFIGLFADRMAHRRRHVVYADAYQHALNKTPLVSKTMDAGKIVKILNEGRDALFWNWLNILRSELVSFLALAILVPLSFVLNPYLAISIIVLCVVFAATTAFVSYQASDMQRAITSLYEKEGSLASDVLSNLALVQSYDVVNEEVGRMQQNSHKVLVAQFPVLNYWAMVVSINQCATSLTILCVVLQGAFLYSLGLVTVGEIVTFIQFVSMVVSRLGQVVGSIQRITRDASKLEAFFSIMDAKAAIEESENATDAGRLKGSVRFDDVWFSYEGKTDSAVKGVSFSIDAGKCLALVGSSGAGKSTTLSLLYRAFDPQRGVIAIDGRDIRDITVSSLRHNIATVFQETLVLNRSVKENIVVGKLTASDEELRAAAARAQALGFIEASDEGFDREIGERGRALSGGERQRLSIARAVLRDAPILILDEATSALDSNTETLLTQALDDLTQQRTTLIIAHRLSTVRKADKILVMDNGRVSEEGTFEELYAKNGIFTKLVEEQYSWHPGTGTEKDTEAEADAAIDAGTDTGGNEKRAEGDDQFNDGKVRGKGRGDEETKEGVHGFVRTTAETVNKSPTAA